RRPATSRLGRRRGRSRRCHRRSSGGGLAGLVLLVLRAEPMGDHLLVATLLAARLVARLWKLAVLPLVVVEETVALRLVRALASLDAALQAFLALRLRGLGLRLRGLALAAVGLRLCHLANAPERKGAGFYPVCRALTMARTLHTPPGGAESACPIGGGGNGNGGSGRVGGRRPRRSGNVSSHRNPRRACPPGTSVRQPRGGRRHRTVPWPRPRAAARPGPLPRGWRPGARRVRDPRGRCVPRRVARGARQPFAGRRAAPGAAEDPGHARRPPNAHAASSRRCPRGRSARLPRASSLLARRRHLHRSRL